MTNENDAEPDTDLDTDLAAELGARAPRDAESAPEGAAAPHPPVEDDLNVTEENADGPAPARTADETP